MLVLLVTKLICKSLSWHIRTKLNEKPWVEQAWYSKPTVAY
jgi:hypothetical protein